jgi:hypothetical protein
MQDVQLNLNLTGGRMAGTNVYKCIEHAQLNIIYRTAKEFW